MIMRIAIFLVALFALVPPSSAREGEWRFRVYLDDKPIGHHHFVLKDSGGQRVLTSEADFEYRLLFVKLYEYSHRNTEKWVGDCLVSIDSRTDANGDLYRVTAAQQGDRFILAGEEGKVTLPACPMSFAYWNPEFLRQDRLVNTQTGELVEIEVSRPDRVSIAVRGEPREALRYRLTAGEMDIELWYSESDEWLALETEARGGRRLRYELL